MTQYPCYSVQIFGAIEAPLAMSAGGSRADDTHTTARDVHGWSSTRRMFMSYLGS